MYGIDRYKNGYVVRYDNYLLSINDLPMDRKSTWYDDEYRYTRETDQFGCRTITIYEFAEDAQAHADRLNAKEQEELREAEKERLERNRALSNALKKVFRPVLVGIVIGSVAGTVVGIALGFLF